MPSLPLRAGALGPPTLARLIPSLRGAGAHAGATSPPGRWAGLATLLLATVGWGCGAAQAAAGPARGPAAGHARAVAATPGHSRAGISQRRPGPENKPGLKAAPAAPAEDATLVAMGQELKRSAGRLRLRKYDPPYFIAYAVKEIHAASIAGKQGAVYLDTTRHDRRAFVDVRVGSYRFDSSEDEELDYVDDDAYDPGVFVPLTDDPSAIRHTLWLLTDLRYKQALSSYLKLKGQRVYQPDDPTRRPSFSPAPAVRFSEPAPRLALHGARWRALVRRLGALIASDPTLFDAEVSVDGQVVTRWLANTEGARLRTSKPMYGVHIVAYSRAPDGMLLDRSADFYAPTEAGLPSDAQLEAATARVMAQLAALRAAPAMTPYTGPAILEERAAGVFFHEVLGHRLEGHRQDDDQEGQTFASYLNKPIMPAFLSVEDDPTRARFGDVLLNGHYRFDDEGVAAQRVVLVDHGVLRGFLLPRRPVKGFTRSNGHGRAQGVMRPVARMGNTIVVAHKVVPRSHLKRMLLKEVQARRKPFGLIVRDITGGSTNTSSYGFQAFKGQVRMVYKVDPKDGHETLVRGVEIVGTPLISLGKILAAGDRSGVFNGYCGAESGMVPVSTVAPALLFSEIELQRSAAAKSRPPVLGPPPAPR